MEVENNGLSSLHLSSLLFSLFPPSLWLFKHKEDPGWNAQYVTATPAGDMWHYSTALVHGHHSRGWSGGERKRTTSKKLRRNMEEEEEHNAGSTNDGVLNPQAVLGFSNPIHSAQAARRIFPKPNSNRVLPLLNTLG